MPADDSDQEAIAEINERVDDGSGCTETWEALSDIRNSSQSSGDCMEMAEWMESRRAQSTATEEKAGGTRRKFLTQAASALGVSVAGLTALSDEVSAKAKSATVTEHSKERRKRLVGQVMSDRKAQKIRKALIQDGYQPDPENAYANQTRHEGETWNTIVIPFKDGNPSQEEQTYLVWSDNPDYEHKVSGFHIEHFDPDSGEGYWEHTAYTVEDGKVVRELQETPNFLGCNNVNWGCVLTLAGAYGGTIAVCGTCAGSSGWLVWACAACISAILGSSGATLSCSWCND